MNSKNLRSSRNWKVLGLLLALAAVMIGNSQRVMSVHAQEERQAQPPPNPCQSIIDEAARQARAGRMVDLDKFRKDLTECAKKNGIPVVESRVNRGTEPRLGDKVSATNLVPPGTNRPGGVWPCLNAPLPSGFLFWIVIGSGTFTQSQYAGNSWQVATVQYESARTSTLYSFLPGFGISGPGTGLVRSVVAPLSPPTPPIDLCLLYVTWGPSPGSPPPFFSAPVYAVCMDMDRS
jgi:hypothetical protein